MESGIITRESKYAFEETVTRLEALLHEKGIKIFAVIDHSGEAASAGLRMLPTKLLIFGNPKGGTPVMQAAPSAALDLPLKILVAEDPAGTVRLSWNDADYLQRRHGFPAEFLGNLGAAAALAGQLAK
jgi:uncharacterized protein (DUF302 family)